MISTTVILQLICRDRPGLVSELSGWVASNDGNIIHADHHTDFGAGLFLSRIEWELEGFKLSRQLIVDSVKVLTKKCEGVAEVFFSDEMPRVAIFVSKQSHCLIDLLWRAKSGELQMHVPLIISNHMNLKSVCDQLNVKFEYVPVKSSSKAYSEDMILNLLLEYKIDLIVLAKYMQILSVDFLNRSPKAINIHHSFLPAFKGSKPYHRAWSRGVKVIGATTHYVTEDLDDGPIIDQTISHVSHRDDINDLIRKGRDLERISLARALRLHLRRQVIVYQGRTAVFA